MAIKRYRGIGNSPLKQLTIVHRAESLSYFEVICHLHSLYCVQFYIVMNELLHIFHHPGWADVFLSHCQSEDFSLLWDCVWLWLPTSLSRGLLFSYHLFSALSLYFFFWKFGMKWMCVCAFVCRHFNVRKNEGYDESENASARSLNNK